MASSAKQQAAGTYEGGYGFHPVTAWCSNIGDNLAVMQRPDHAGAFTATDHLAVLGAAIAQIPALYRRDPLFTARRWGRRLARVGRHLSALNTVPVHGGRGPQVEYFRRPAPDLDERTRAAICLARAWGPDSKRSTSTATLLGSPVHGPGWATTRLDIRGVAADLADGSADDRPAGPPPRRRTRRLRREPKLAVRGVRDEHPGWAGPANPHPAVGDVPHSSF